VVDVVVKVGGGLLAHVEDFDAVLSTIDSAARSRRILVVPGGGPFADAVRAVDRQLSLSDGAAHWMAVLAMDQYACVIADRLTASSLVADRDAVREALHAGRLPVLAPFDWMRRVDPLPHSWDVTSDSIAAWVAAELGARRLVLVKPPGARAGAANLVDAHFSRAVPTGLEVVMIGAEQTDVLRHALDKP
jgi:5-(aminomethyl)-3-furanmethanol phosphate kinase